ncbi:MAG: hypothetical protein K4571_18305 [Deltaproteobacteria bacterium]
MWAVSRFEETGRFVDPAYILNEVETKPKEVYNNLKSYKGVSSYEAYDNNVPKGQAPKLIEQSREAENTLDLEGERRLQRPDDSQHPTEGNQEKTGQVKGFENEPAADGSTGSGSLEGDESGNIPADGGGQSPLSVERGGSEADLTGDGNLDEGRDDEGGSLAGEPAPIHLQDEGEDSGVVSAGPGRPGETDTSSPVESNPPSEPRTKQLTGVKPGNYRALYNMFCCQMIATLAFLSILC